MDAALEVFVLNNNALRLAIRVLWHGLAATDVAPGVKARDNNGMWTLGRR